MSSLIAPVGAPTSHFGQARNTLYGQYRESGALSVQIHVVQAGETLWRLAKQYRVSVNRIVEANGLEQPEKLIIGQALLIPPPYPRYTVQPGDTLGAVARQYGVRVQDVMQINDLTDPDLIYPGQPLMIPVTY